MVRCRSINILILAFIFSFAGLACPLIANSASEDPDDLSIDEDFTPVPPPPPRPAAKSPFTVGLIGGVGFASQSAKSFTTTDQLTYNISGFSGTPINAGMYLLNKWSSDLAFRMYLSYQSYQLTAKATEVGVPIAAKTVNLSETMGAGGVDILYYFWSKHSLWMGVGVEYARGVSLNITLDGINLPTTQEDFTNYLKLNASVGFDLPLGRQFVLTPLVRAGGIVSVKPSIIAIDGQIALGYHL